MGYRMVWVSAKIVMICSLQDKWHIDLRKTKIPGHPNFSPLCQYFEILIVYILDCINEPTQPVNLTNVLHSLLTKLQIKTLNKQAWGQIPEAVPKTASCMWFWSSNKYPLLACIYPSCEHALDATLQNWRKTVILSKIIIMTTTHIIGLCVRQQVHFFTLVFHVGLQNGSRSPLISRPLLQYLLNFALILKQYLPLKFEVCL